MKKLITRSCEEIMTTVYKPIEFVIDGLLAQGLYILAGAPKVGKSWLALSLSVYSIDYYNENMDLAGLPHYSGPEI